LHTGKNNNKNVTGPIRYLSKKHFLSKIGPTQVPLIIFMGIKNISSKTTVNRASKSIKKNFVQKIYVYRPNKWILLF
jgi:hypothetical protein